MDQHRMLAEMIGRHAASDGVHATALPRLHLVRKAQPTEPMHGVHEPALCLIVQGAKRVLVGDRVFRYDPGCYLVVSVDVPVVGQVTDATPDEPYLSLRFDIDPKALAALLLDAGPSLPQVPSRGTAGVAVSTVTPELLDAVARLVRLLDCPGDLAVLAPLAEREILYRLLTGEQAAMLRQIALGESRLAQVNKAIAWIKRNFRDQFSIAALAAEAGMSPSALHQHFKAVTAMSPLQYQKQLRLQEARRLILTRAMDAANAGFSVGYESPSQFSREYSRLFGAPPLRDAARLRALPEAAALSA
ncbi:MAG TPA: AraC family transcriptional regulator [Azospirillaceae bacterium]|nr:AraC family transcriptional regulator [Azospirillaceae bacterium]